MSTQPDRTAAMTPDELARATADAMYAADACSRALGLELLEVRPGYARLRMTVRADFLNGHQICHGGLIFTLADSTFAFACNTLQHQHGGSRVARSNFCVPYKAAMC